MRCFQIKITEDPIEHVHSQPGDIRYNNGFWNANARDKQFYGTYDWLGNRMRCLFGVWLDFWHGTSYDQCCHRIWPLQVYDYSVSFIIYESIDIESSLSCRTISCPIDGRLNSKQAAVIIAFTWFWVTPFTVLPLLKVWGRYTTGNKFHFSFRNVRQRSYFCLTRRSYRFQRAFSPLVRSISLRTTRIRRSSSRVFSFGLTWFLSSLSYYFILDCSALFAITKKCYENRYEFPIFLT